MTTDFLSKVRKIDRFLADPSITSGERFAAEGRRRQIVQTATEQSYADRVRQANANARTKPNVNPARGGSGSAQQNTTSPRYATRTVAYGSTRAAAASAVLRNNPLTGPSPLSAVFGVLNVGSNLREGWERGNSGRLGNPVFGAIEATQEVLGEFIPAYSAAEFITDGLFSAYDQVSGLFGVDEALGKESTNTPEEKTRSAVNSFGNGIASTGTTGGEYFNPTNNVKTSGTLSYDAFNAPGGDWYTQRFTAPVSVPFTLTNGPCQASSAACLVADWGDGSIQLTGTAFQSFADNVQVRNLEFVPDGDTEPLPSGNSQSVPNSGSRTAPVPQPLPQPPSSAPVPVTPNLPFAEPPPVENLSEQPSNPVLPEIPSIPGFFGIPGNAANLSPTPKEEVPGKKKIPNNVPPPCNTCGNPGINATREAQGKILDALGTVGGAAGFGGILAKLNQMQEFAEKAWKNTHLDKVINLLTLITVLHNASMISRDIGETLGYVVSNALAAIGVKDEDGNALDINNIIGSSVTDFIKSVVGEDVYDDTRTAWQKANRVLQAGSNIVWTLRSINDTTQDVLEWTAENTGKIGNALKKYGVVGDRAYPWMSERVKAQDFYRRRFSRVFDGLESAENTASSLAVVTSDVREIQEEISELGDARTRFTDAVSAFGPEDTPGLDPNSQLPTSAPENQPIADAEEAAENVSQSPDIAISSDAQRGDLPDATT